MVFPEQSDEWSDESFLATEVSQSVGLLAALVSRVKDIALIPNFDTEQRTNCGISIQSK